MKNVKKIVVYAVIIAVVVGGAIALKSRLSASAKGKPTQAVASKT